jgi:hypothetical protein
MIRTPTTEPIPIPSTGSIYASTGTEPAHVSTAVRIASSEYDESVTRPLPAVARPRDGH